MEPRDLRLIDFIDLLQTRDHVLEIAVNGKRSVFFALDDGSLEYQTFTIDEKSFFNEIQELAFRENTIINRLNPIAGGLISKNIRWQVAVKPVASDLFNFHLRKGDFENISVEQFHYTQSTKQNLASSKPLNIIFGETFSGKSSYLMSLLKHLHKKDRVILLENQKELLTLSPLWTCLTSYSYLHKGKVIKVNLSELVECSLRMRPDVLVLGEITAMKDPAVQHALASGYQKIYLTLHARSAEEALQKLDVPKKQLMTNTKFIKMHRGSPPMAEEVHPHSPTATS